MTITAKQAIRHIRSSLSGDPDIDGIELVNTAGKLMYGLRSWNFRQRGPVTAGFTASQAFVELPANFGEMTSIRMTNGLTTNIHQATMDELVGYRVESIGNPRDFWYAVSFENLAVGGTRIVPRLELYPTPSTTDATALTYAYRARWVEATSDDEILAGVPELAEPLYIRMCRQLARSYDDEDVVAYTESLGSIRASEEFRSAIQQDVNLRKSYGTLLNGIAQVDVDAGFWDRQVGAPS